MDAVGSVRQTATLVDILSHIGTQTQCSSAQTLAKIYSLSGTWAATHSHYMTRLLKFQTTCAT